MGNGLFLSLTATSAAPCRFVAIASASLFAYLSTVSLYIKQCLSPEFGVSTFLLHLYSSSTTYYAKGCSSVPLLPPIYFLLLWIKKRVELHGESRRRKEETSSFLYTLDSILTTTVANWRKFLNRGTF